MGCVQGAKGRARGTGRGREGKERLAWFQKCTMLHLGQLPRTAQCLEADSGGERGLGVSVSWGQFPVGKRGGEYI